MLKAAVRREFDVIMAWSVDRLGRSLQDLVAFLSDIHSKRVELYLHQQGVDTTTPSGKAMFQMLGVFAEFERAMIRERVLAGLKRARANGKKLGRPTISAAKERAIRADLAAGLGFRKIMARHCVGTSVIQRIKAEIAARRRGSRNLA
jgi:DNA invertase Pin-like site-specific DNA recombinase